ncbi:MAG TPA: hypothetical protein VFD23_06740 [Clostridia bacterium]|nr:hypothetical protein [Clostridia bacterium]
MLLCFRAGEQCSPLHLADETSPGIGDCSCVLERANAVRPYICMLFVKIAATAEYEAASNERVTDKIYAKIVAQNQG